RLVLLLLAFLADDLFAGIAHALALVGLGFAVAANLGRNLANLLLVDAGDADFGRLADGERDALRRMVDYFMAEAERKLQVLALHGGTIADAGDLELPLETFLDALQNVDDLRARHAPLRAGRLGLVARLHGDLAVLHRHQNLFVHHEIQFALGALRRHG